MKIAVIGAGFAGLSTAKVLREFDHEVVVFDKAPDVGGVWSVTRRYPGLRTQNNKGTYALSDLPMPRSYPEWPTGAQVQAYLESYVDKFGLGPSLRLGTEVTYATPVEDGWEVTAGPATATFDHLVVQRHLLRPHHPSVRGGRRPRERGRSTPGRVRLPRPGRCPRQARRGRRLRKDLLRRQQGNQQGRRHHDSRRA
jgi:cation diffusion facilitator CzcD-associated flavoprotein CzcO